MFLPILGIILGIIIGLFLPFQFPVAYSSYVAIGILACIDSVFGGIRANMEDSFELSVFLSGFFCNGVLAIALTFLGEKVGISLNIVALIVYGSRLFQNFTIIRKYLLNKFSKHDNM